ncbi:MAG: methylmalonyl-CoA mutase subunit beta, partial [Alphaproteobacteria bacterium]
PRERPLPDDTILKLAADFPPATKKAWRELAEKSLKGGSFERLVSRTDDGIELRPLYTPEDWSGEGDPSGFPGLAPFERGSHAQPRPRREAWDIRARPELPDARAANEAILDDLARGVTSIELKAGPGGVPADEIGRALHDVDPAVTPVALDAGAAFAEAAEALLAFWRDSGANPAAIRGALNADPLGALAREGALPEKLDQSLARMAGLARNGLSGFPNVTAARVDTRPYHNAGATQAQELGAMLATGAAYVRVLSEGAGLSVDGAFRRIAVTLTADADMFLTIAKLRAARLLWAHMADACGAGEDAQALRLHVQTSERMMTRFDPYVNMLRMTAATFGAAVGGADGITVLPHTHAIGLPDGFARRIARNTQIVLMEESNIGAVMDPAGGAHAFESLTADLARAGWAAFQEIEAEGGMAAVLRSGSLRKRIDEAWEKRALRIATRREALVGVSLFPKLDEAQAETAGPRPEPPPPEGAGERIEPLPQRRLAQDFERLREAGLKAGAQVYSVNLGKLSDYVENASFARSLLEAGGLSVPEREAAESPQAAAEAVKAAGVKAAVLCGTPQLFGEHAVDYARALKQAGVTWLCLAANPGPHEAVSRDAGIDAFIYPGCDALSVLRDAHGALNIAGGQA